MNLLVKAFFWLSFLLGTILIMWSVGYMLALFGLALVPLVILHVVAGIKGGKRLPELSQWMWLTSGAYLLFTLVRPDLDDTDNFLGITFLLHEMGLRPDQYLEGESKFYYLSIFLVLVILVVDILILVRSKRKRV